MMQAGRILYAVHEGTYVLKLEGEVRVPLCASQVAAILINTRSRSTPMFSYA